MAPDGPVPPPASLSPSSSPPPPEPASRVDHDGVRVSVGALLGGAAVVLAAVIAVVVLIVASSSSVAHTSSGVDSARAITTSWQRFVNLTQNPVEQSSPSQGTKIDALLAPNSPACDDNCSAPTTLSIYTKMLPFKPSIRDITVTGDSATATVMQRGELGGEVTQTVQFSRHSGAWQISVLPSN